MSKDNSIVFRVSEEESEMIRSLREEHNINISSFLRDNIKNRYNYLSGELIGKDEEMIESTNQYASEISEVNIEGFADSGNFPYMPIGREILLVKKDPSGNFLLDNERYPNPVYVKTTRGSSSNKVEGEKIQIPLFDIACNPTRKVSNNNNKNKLINEGKDAIYKCEDLEIFNIIKENTLENNFCEFTELSEKNLNKAMCLIEKENNSVCNIVIHHSVVPEILSMDSKYLKINACNSNRFYFNTHLAEFRGAKIWVSSKLDVNEILLCASPSRLGTLCIKEDISFKEKNNFENLREGYVFYETIGIFINYNRNSAVIKLVDSKEKRSADFWMEEARRASANSDYYRSLLDQIGDILGKEARISNDGSVQDSYIRSKIPELVRQRLA